jgi:hypothetical protein
MARSLGKMPTTSVRRLISLFKRSIAWSQYTFSASSTAERDHVTDFHVRTVNHHPVDQQFDERTALAEVGMLEAFTNGSTKIFDPRSQVMEMVALHGFSFEHLLIM